MKSDSRSSTTVGRSDLAAVIAAQNKRAVEAAVSMLGLEITPLKPEPVARPPELPVRRKPKPAPFVEINSSGYPQNIQDVRFWHWVGYRQLAPLEKAESTDAWHEWHVEEGAVAATHQLLADWSEIGPRLRHCLLDVRSSSQPDLRKLVAKVAERELLVDIPWRKKRRWGAEVFLVVDNSIRLTSFAPDHEAIVRKIQQILPAAKVHVVQGASPDALWHRVVDGQTPPQSQPRFVAAPPDATILVLGDLGCLSRDANFWRLWLHWGLDEQRNGARLIALVPYSTKRIVTALRQVYSVESWQSEKFALDDPVLREDLVEQLLVLASPTLRLEPGLLRDLRLLLPNATDGSLEVDVWNSPLLVGNHPDGATIDRDAARQHLLPKFEKLPQELRREALGGLRRWRLRCRHDPEVWFEEVLCLSPESQSLLPQQDLADARASVRQFYIDRKSNNGRSGHVKVWMYNATDRLTDFAYQDADVGPLLRETRRELHEEPDAILAGTDLRELPAGPLRQFRIDIEDDQLRVANINAPGTVTGSITMSASLTGSVSQIEIGSTGELINDAFWKTGKPDFVCDYDTDEYGAWFEFSVERAAGQGNVTQRMRWIRPGTFMMGSPTNEIGRNKDEVQHLVTLSRGYWLADTACTQELWTAVTERNPSFFIGERRPVENVNYNDVSEFLDQLASKVPGLQPALPTEAQWENACRAATETPFSFGETITAEQANFNEDNLNRKNQKGTNRQDTVQVKSLPCNRWGLYQMHGNVSEWCSDWYGEYSPQSQFDPTGPKRGTSRVVRGGSRYRNARRMRSACRDRNAPGDRYRNLGFRLLSAVLSEPTNVAQVPVAERGTEQTWFGGDDQFFLEKTIFVDDDKPAHVPLSRRSQIQIQTNLESISFQQMKKPDWAVEYGRDLFGIYADFEVKVDLSNDGVRQRLRWIPPGHFQMGSPESEPGRREDEVLHPVVISTGFWMFDTPCTQRLWQTLMLESNASKFQDPDRPVENVDWEDALRFATLLAERVDLQFTLPTEAQWEYACRGGTSTAIYTGPLEIRGDANAPALDPIAWYGGNCGHKYDLETGENVNWFNDQQYSFEQGGTRKVKKKRPNPWGLYDMLGNVWEWCHDWYADYPDLPQTDPVGPESGSGRVMRGGGWSIDARVVRSACRLWGRPGSSDQYLGFRLLSTAGPAQSRPASPSPAPANK